MAAPPKEAPIPLYHEVQEQMPGLRYCINDNPIWRTILSLSLSYESHFLARKLSEGFESDFCPESLSTILLSVWYWWVGICPQMLFSTLLNCGFGGLQIWQGELEPLYRTLTVGMPRGQI